MERAKDKVLHMQAHADAIDALMDNGTLTLPGEDPLTPQFPRIAQRGVISSKPT